MKKQGQWDGCVLGKQEDGKGEPGCLGKEAGVSTWPEMVWRAMLQDETHSPHLLYHGAGGTGVTQRISTEICGVFIC